MNPLMKNILMPQVARQNLAAFAELPQLVAQPKANVAPLDAVLADSIFLREGKLGAPAGSKMPTQSTKAERQALVRAFAELPSAEACQAKKATPVAMDSILSDSLKVREGYTASHIGKAVWAGAKALFADLRGAAACGWSALLGLLRKPFTALADAKSNRAAFAQLPNHPAGDKVAAKAPSVDSILEDSLFLRDNLVATRNEAVAKQKPASPKANKALFAALPGELAETVDLEEKQAIKALRQVNYQHFANMKAKQQSRVAGVQQFFDAAQVPVLAY